jgi:hypothetical protein
VAEVTEYRWWQWAAWIDYTISERYYVDIHTWLGDNFNQDMYSYDFSNVVLFREYSDAVFFQLAWCDR